MHGAFEAVGGIADGRPRCGRTTGRCIVLRADVAAQEEHQVLASLHASIQQLVTLEGAGGIVDGVIILVNTHTAVEQAEVEEVTQLVELALALHRRGTVVDIDLRGAVNVLMVYIHVVVSVAVAHDVGDVVVVRHRERHGIRVGLTQIGLRVVCHVVVVLIPVQWRGVVHEGLTVAVDGGILGRGEDLPTRVGDFEGTRCDGRNLHTHTGTRQHGGRSLDLTNLGYTRLELEVDVHDMALTHRHDVVTTFVALLIVVEVDHGDDFLLLQVVEIRLARDIERRGLVGHFTVDLESCLEVDHTFIVCLVHQYILLDGITYVVCFLCRSQSQVCKAFTLALLTNLVISAAEVIVLLHPVLVKCVIQILARLLLGERTDNLAILHLITEVNALNIVLERS